MPKFATDIDALAALAEPEDWGYKNTPCPHSHPILRNYINYTYRRIAEEKKTAGSLCRHLKIVGRVATVLSAYQPGLCELQHYQVNVTEGNWHLRSPIHSAITTCQTISSFSSGLPSAFGCFEDLRSVSFNGLGISKYARKFIQLKRLTDKVRDSQPSEGGVDMLFTIGTRENYFHIRRGPLDPV